jgi:hypothetical protein
MKYFKVQGLNSSLFNTYSAALYAANNNPDRIKQYDNNGAVIKGDDIEIVSKIKAKKTKKSSTETTTETTTHI